MKGSRFFQTSFWILEFSSDRELATRKRTLCHTYNYRRHTARCWDKGIFILSMPFANTVDAEEEALRNGKYGERSHSSSVSSCFQDGIVESGGSSATFSSALRFISRFARAYRKCSAAHLRYLGIEVGDALEIAEWTEV